ncbi:MAG: carboxypeptidase regulatory-like domain-containing protein [Acidobacteria bacterium]|nr:carboxypeptidase regulatory-like domain-containing protein [Acidobacteriota bacterium]
MPRGLSATWLLPCATHLLLLYAQPVASLSGHVHDVTGAPISGAKVDLRSWGKPSQPQRTSTDHNGRYEFSNLPHGDYEITLSCPGFHTLSVKPVSIRNGNPAAVPSVELDVGEPCSDRPRIESVHFLPDLSARGSIVGSVDVTTSARSASIGRISQARVELLCSPTRVCGTTQTGAWGYFRFSELNPDGYGIRVTHPGFYPIERFGYGAKSGVERTYGPITLEPCSPGNCDPKRRRAKPLCISE